MFSVYCQCGRPVNFTTDRLNQPAQCPSCKRQIVCITAEVLNDAAATADFDAALLVVDGPQRAGQLLRLGGCAAIEIGADPSNHLVLAGQYVSPSHCKLARLDFGPSRWKIDDCSSEAGVFVNGERVTSHELVDGDTLQIGDYEVAYQLTPMAAPVDREENELPDVAAPSKAEMSILKARAAPLIPASPRGDDWPVCPSCARDLDPGAKICVDCGIHISTGRPLLTSEALDENLVHGNAETVLNIVSWLMWVTPLPIPLASSAYGKFKPYAIWTIALLTVVISVWFFVANLSSDSGTGRNLLLWPTHPDYSRTVDAATKKFMQTQGRSRIRTLPDGTPQYLSEEEIREAFEIAVRERTGEFHVWQLFTHALLHDTDSVLGFLFHLGGNMLFLIVFGSRVNAIIGNTATAITYPVLAAAGGLVFILTLPAGAATPLLGASGAINGLAGLYLVLLPAHFVYCAMWLRFRFYLAMKIFALRGFWVLLIYFAYDIAMVALGNQGTTAHWAHIGGFLTGVVIGIGLLVSRMFNCQNGDLLSLLLGKHAWPLIGKPSQWQQKRDISQVTA